MVPSVDRFRGNGAAIRAMMSRRALAWRPLESDTPVVRRAISSLALLTLFIAGSGVVGVSTDVSAAEVAHAPVVGMASAPDGGGYWLAGSDGGVFAYGDAGFYGSAGGLHLNAPVVGMASTPDGGGYWLAGSDGGVFAYGDAGFYGSAGGLHLNAPVVGMASTPDGGGYWLAGSDGGVFAYGDAGFYGSAGGLHLNAPVVGMASTPDGGGYWLAGSDGGVFAYGDAGFYGSAGGLHLNAPVVGMASTPDGGGYWLAGSDGGVFAYGDAGFYGSAGGALTTPIAGMVGTPSGTGYWLVTSDGLVATYGDAGYFGAQRRTIALYGDSLGMEAAPFFKYLAGASGASTLLRAYNGWAICDDLESMARDAASLHPSVAVIEFSGNAMTPCMSGYSMGTTPYYDKYEADAQQAIDVFHSRGIPVVLIGAPISAWANLAANLDYLNGIYRSLVPINTGVSYSDAGQSVLADGEFTLTLPCLPFETCTSPNGSNVVRSPDGVHFCPSGIITPQGWYDVCSVYSSGAFRFALAMLVASSGP